jgi:carbon monoxide dehydrogenase subunit G
METVTQSVTVNAPAEKIFKLLEDPARAVVFVPGLNRIDKVQSKGQVGDTWEYEFNWLGWMVSGRSECTGFSRPSEYQFKTLTGNASTWTYRCEPSGGATKLTLEVEYELPQMQLARFASETALKTLNQNAAREVVHNIKALVED